MCHQIYVLWGQFIADGSEAKTLQNYTILETLDQISTTGWYFHNNKNQKKKIHGLTHNAFLMFQQILEKILSLMGKHFPKTHNLHKLVNNNDMKVSYSSLLNFKCDQYS